MSRKSQLNRGVFRCYNARLCLLQGQQGGCNRPCAFAVTQLPSSISLILLHLSLDNRTPLRRRIKIGEDGSDPPLKRGLVRHE